MTSVDDHGVKSSRTWTITILTMPASTGGLASRQKEREDDEGKSAEHKANQ